MPIANRILCTECGSKFHYQTFCPYKKRKPIAKVGKETKIYEAFRKTVAIPYLDKKYGHVCSVPGCAAVEVDVAHIKTRGSRHDLKFSVNNVRYLCRYHHRLETDGKLKP